MSDPRAVWPNERIEYLRAALKTNASLHRIADDMSKRFGVPISRSAIIGKAHRLGEDLMTRVTEPPPARKKPDGSARSARSATRPSKRRPVEPPPVEQIHEPPLPPPPLLFTLTGQLTFNELQPNSCRYPFGARPPFMFCGVVTKEPPYCAVHAELCFPRQRPR